MLEALAAGCSEIECPDENKKRQLQGKQKAKVLVREFFVHNKKIESLLQKRKREGNNIKVERKAIRATLTNPTVLFKTKRTDKKIAASCQRQMTTHLPMFINIVLAKL